jgi:hypothetical protein
MTDLSELRCRIIIPLSILLLRKSRTNNFLCIMGANLPDLPEELLLAIASSIHSLKEVSLVSKRLCRISACVAVCRTRDDSSHQTISEAIQRLRCLNTWNTTQNLVQRLCAHIRVRFVQDIRNRRLDDALQSLQSLGRLPGDTTIQEHDLLLIIEAIVTWASITTNIGIRNWFFPIIALELLSSLLLLVRIPEKQLFRLVRIIRRQIIQDIRNGRHYFSNIMLRDLSTLTWEIEMPNNFYFSIVEAIQDSVIQFIHNGEVEDAKATLQVLRHLPVDTYVPNNFFLKVIETIRSQLERTISHGIYDTMKLLQILGALPSTTRVPDNYFFGVIAHFWSKLLQDVKRGAGLDAIRILRMIRQLPANTTIPKDQFLAVEGIIRNQITQNMSSGRIRGATRMAQVLRNLSSIESYAFRYD